MRERELRPPAVAAGQRPEEPEEVAEVLPPQVVRPEVAVQQEVQAVGVAGQRRTGAAVRQRAVAWPWTARGRRRGPVSSRAGSFRQRWRAG